MNRFYFFSLLSFFFLNAVFAQPILKPSIGLDSLPTPETPICNIPLYLDGFESSGLSEGDTIPDFQLYNLDGTAFHIADALALGKPVLLVNGNYTCPVFRTKVPVINQIIAEFGTEVITCVIYTVEAHPEIDISPYFGYVNTGSPNINAGILYRQPNTYGERLDIVADMLAEMNIQAPVYVDGPCNEWWSVFGPAPNNAYLISPEGIVLAKHGWFHRSPDDMLCDIEKYLQPATDCGNSSGNFGSFTIQWVTDSIAYGLPGDPVYVETLLENPTAYPVNIEIKRMIETVPAGWTTAMCIDICYAPTADYTTIQIPPGSSQSFIMDFFTNPDEAGAGMVQMGFRNLDQLMNKFTRRMYASTLLSNTGENELSPELKPSIFPLPAQGKVNTRIPSEWFQNYQDLSLQLFDLNGKTLMTTQVNDSVLSIEQGSLPAGVYPVQILADKKVLYEGRILFQ
ncbi:MAG: deiodinase-like protein [Saprospiraceae bacterium]